MAEVSYISLATLLATVFGPAETVNHIRKIITKKKSKNWKRSARQRNRPRGKPRHYDKKDMPHTRRHQR